MKVPVEIVGLFALSLALFSGGCGDGKSKSSSASKEASSSAKQEVSSALLKANLSAMAMRGRNLYMGIIMATTDREASALPSVWPCTVAEKNVPDDDISSRAYKSATEYFNALFDIKNYGKSEWEPYVNADLDVLSGAGVPKMTDPALESKNIAWCIAANVSDALPDNFPVLISANFNPAFLLRKWDGSTDGAKLLPIGPSSGAEKSMFGDQAIVIVRKSGSVQTIMAKSLTYDTLYDKTEFALPDTETPLVYLTPTGAVEPVGHK